MIVEGWLKRCRKSAGNLTFAKWKSITTARQKSPGPPPETVSQRVHDQRTQVRAMKTYYDAAGEVVRVGMRETNGQMGPWSAFVKWNVTLASNFTAPGSPFTVFSLLRFGKGSIVETPFTVISSAADNFITLTWSPIITGNQQLDDVPALMIRNVSNNTWIGSKWFGPSPEVIRSTGEIIFVVEPGSILEGDEVIVYFFFTGGIGGLNEDKVSEQSLQTITVSA